MVRNWVVFGLFIVSLAGCSFNPPQQSAETACSLPTGYVLINQTAIRLPDGKCPDNGGDDTIKLIPGYSVGLYQ